MDIAELLSRVSGFQWDSGNIEKNWNTHRVTFGECEQAFFNRPLVLAQDVKHSAAEARFSALARTDADRRLFLAFTIRDKLVRVISARDMSRIERREYEKYLNDASQEGER